MNCSGGMRRLRAQTLSLAVVALLAACGGGGGGDSTPVSTAPSATPVPETLTLTAPSSGEAATDLQFGSSASNLSGLAFSWDFGDGKTSTEANPKHAYAKGGDYEVLLKISNTAGASREQKVRVSVTNLDNVKGLVCNGAGQTGWCWQQPKPTGNVRSELAVLSATTAFNVGENGEIFKTTDGGTTWTAAVSGITASLRAISFSSDKDGWIAGDFGALLRTSDGGASWTLSMISQADYYYNYGGTALTALDANTAVLSDYRGVRTTTDGGKTWSSYASAPTLVTPKGVFWTYSSYQGAVTKSTDFGKSTSTVLTITENNSYLSSSDMRVFDEKLVFVSTLHYIYSTDTTPSYYKAAIRRSDDGGQTWTSLGTSGVDTSDLSGYQTSRVLRASTDDKELVARIGANHYLSQDGGVTWTKSVSPTGYYSDTGPFLSLAGRTVLTTSGSSVYRSEDMGKTWRSTSPGGNSISLSGLRRVGTDAVLMRGSDGSAYVSADQGKTWKQMLGASGSQLPAYAGGGFFDAKHGFLMNRQGELSETTDGGLNWKTKLPGAQQGNVDLQVAGDKAGWMLLGDGRLSITSDAGASWGSAVRVGSTGFTSIGMADAQRGWGRYSSYSSTAQFAVTADGGKSWTDVAAPGSATGLFMDAGSQLIAFGGSGLIAFSSDAGKTWSQRYTGTTGQIYAMASPEAGTLWLVGQQGLVRRSTDKGQTWSEVQLGTEMQLTAIAFASPKVGWIVGAQGTVYATLDGGKTWVRQMTGTQRNLTRVLVADVKTAWILGEGGTVLATGNGGF